MNKLDAIIAAQAVYKELGDRLSTKDPSNLRGVLDAHFKALYKTTGGRSYDLMIGGIDVGTYTFAKKKDRVVKDLVITDREKFANWLKDSDNDNDMLIDMLINTLMSEPHILEGYINASGELPDGIDYEERTIKGGISERGTLKVRFEDVRKALAGDFSPAIEAMHDTKLLDEGSEE